MFGGRTLLPNPVISSVTLSATVARGYSTPMVFGQSSQSIEPDTAFSRLGRDLIFSASIASINTTNALSK